MSHAETDSEFSVLETPELASPTVAPGRRAGTGAARVITERNLMEMALYAFGDFRTAEKWMSTYHPRLQCEPAQAGQDPDGVRMVVRLLEAISQGTEP